MKKNVKLTSFILSVILIAISICIPANANYSEYPDDFAYSEYFYDDEGYFCVFLGLINGKTLSSICIDVEYNRQQFALIDEYYNELDQYAIGGITKTTSNPQIGQLTVMANSIDSSAIKGDVDLACFKFSQNNNNNSDFYIVINATDVAGNKLNLMFITELDFNNQEVHQYNLTGNTATCKNDGIGTFVCDDCGKSKTRNTKKINHITEVRNIIESTFEKEGYSGDEYCIMCDEMIKKGETVSILSIGDIYQDGKVNVKDARLLLRYIAKLDGLTDSQLLVADVNSDGKINSKDAKKILRVAAKLESI